MLIRLTVREHLQIATSYMLLDDDTTRQEILSVVNTIWDSGLQFGMETLPALISVCYPILLDIIPLILFTASKCSLSY